MVGAAQELSELVPAGGIAMRYENPQRLHGSNIRLQATKNGTAV
jgi:hypothetical protein